MPTHFHPVWISFSYTPQKGDILNSFLLRLSIVQDRQANQEIRDDWLHPLRLKGVKAADPKEEAVNNKLK